MVLSMVMTHIIKLIVLREIDMEDEYVYNKECTDCGDMTCAEVCFFYEDETYCEDCCPDGYGE